MLTRRTVQFHWRNAGYATFDDFLAALTQPKRKKIRAERRKVEVAGVDVQRRIGREITEADWAFFYRCYRATYAAHYSTSYLNFEFFLRLAESLPESLLLVLARRGRRPIGAVRAFVHRARDLARLCDGGAGGGDRALGRAGA